jgi:Sel1 repeat/Domain of unknown function (DUF4034)
VNWHESWLTLCVRLGIASMYLTYSLAGNAQTLPGCELITDNPSMTTTVARIQGYLREKKFFAIEDEWQDKLKRVGLPNYPDLLLYLEIQRVLSDDPALEPLIEQWKSQQPNSFFAYLSSGIYRASLGYKKRGSALARDTSKEQFDAMALEHRKGLLDLERAASLSKSSALPMASMMNILRAQSGADINLELLLRAEKADPRNLSARRSRITSISLAWGGSNEQLTSYYAQVGDLDLPDGYVRFLRYSILMEQARDFELFNKEKRRAIETWKKAVGLCQYAEAPLRAVLRTAYDLEDWGDVRNAASNLLVILPKNAQIFTQRAWAHEKLANYLDMERDYLSASDLGSAYAQNRIGYFYMTGQYVKKDLVKARKFLQLAANNGSAHATENLQWLNQYGDKK